MGWSERLVVGNVQEQSVGDPLNTDADQERAWQRQSRARFQIEHYDPTFKPPCFFLMIKLFS